MRRNIVSTIAFFFLCLVLTASSEAGTNTANFNTLGPGSGNRAIPNRLENGLTFYPTPSGAEVPTEHIYHCAAGTENYPEGAGCYLQFMQSSGGLNIERNVDWMTFSLTSVDLAEYSKAFQGQQTVITFVGHRLDDTTVTQSFTLDGVIDGNGGAPDFQTFQFNSDFIGLKKVEVQGLQASIDNLVVNYEAVQGKPLGSYWVSAGSGSTIGAFNRADLAGFFNDDGIRLAGPVTIQWESLSGDGIVFGDIHSPQTTARFPGPGNYNLRLTATDGVRSGSSQVLVTVKDTVNEGNDRRIPFGTELSLQGSIVNQGAGFTGGITTQWAKVSGPGNVSFINASALSTTASFSAPGTYVLSLTAINGSLSVADSLQVLVVDPNIQTGMTTQSPFGDPVGKGVNRSLSLLDGDFSASRSSNIVSIIYRSASGSTEWWFEFAAPYDGPLGVGKYEEAKSLGSFSDKPEMNITSSFSRYDNVSGHFEVKKITYGPNGTILAFWATFSQSVGSSPALTGEIKFDAGSTVASINQAPVGYVGRERHAIVNQEMSVDVQTVDDGMPSNTLTYLWTKVSGPGSATFSQPSAATTGVTFSEEGIYTVRVTISDGELSCEKDLVVKVRDPKTNNRLRFFDGETKYNFGPLDGDYTIRSSEGWLEVSLYTPDPYYSYPQWKLSLSAPKGGTLATGFYFDPGHLDDAEPQLELQTPHSIFSQQPASFVIRELRFNDDGSIAGLWVQFEIDGEETGEFRFNASATVPVTNHPPLVRAGEDQTIPNRGIATLDGIAVDDGVSVGKKLKTVWKKVSGPGKVQFKNPASLYTTAVFSAPGTYVLRLIASDGVHSSSDDVTITQTGEVTSLWVSGGPGESLTEGKTIYFTPREADFDVRRDSLTGGVSVIVSKHEPLSGFWWIDFAAPGYLPLKPGVYVGAKTAHFSPSETPTYPKLEVAGDGMGGNTLSGKFVVHEIVVGPHGVEKFWATFSCRVENSSGEATGEIRYNTDPGEVTASGANQPPSVSAGDSQSSWLSTQLRGSVADDGLPKNHVLQNRWSVVSGPGVVTFGDASSPSSNVIFSVPGEYVLRLHATDGEFAVASDVTFQVSDGGIPGAVGKGNFTGVVSSHGETNQFAGTITLTTSAGGSFTGTINTGSERRSFGGTFSSNGKWNGTVQTTNGSLQLELATNFNGQLVGTMNDGSVTSSILLENQAGGRSFSDALYGLYTFALLNELTPGTGVPPGHGFGLAGVNLYNHARYVIALPDGKIGTGGGVITKNGVLPIQTTIPNRQGAVSGLVSFVEHANFDYIIDRVECGGKLVWIKPSRGARAGFVAPLTFVGSPFRPSHYGSNPPPGGINPRVTVDNPLWSESLGSNLILRTKPAPAKLSLTGSHPGIVSIHLIPEFGGFTGIYIDPLTHKPGQYNGIILQNSRKGFGFSLDGTETKVGAVELQLAQ